MELSTAILINAIFSLAALITAVTGFGFAMIATPLTVLVLPPSVVVPLVVLSWLPLALLLAVSSFREMAVMRIIRLYFCALPGVPLGVYVLREFEAPVMSMVIGCLTLAAAGVMILHTGRPLQRTSMAMAGAGFFSGVMGGVCGMTGPPVVFLGLKQRWPQTSMRADLIGYFLILHASMVLFFRESGMIGIGAVEMSAWALPGVTVGYIAGLRLRCLVSDRSYKTMVLVLAGSAGVLAIVLA